MSCKLTCPGCDRYLSSIFRAYEDGRPCPQCGASLSAASEQFYRELPDYRQLPYIGQFAPCDCCEKSVPRSDLATGDDGETWICPSCVPASKEIPMSARKRTEEVLAEHATTFVDQDGDTRCDCGKWLEPGEHEWPTHVAWMLDEAGVLGRFRCPRCTHDSHADDCPCGCERP